MEIKEIKVADIAYPCDHPCNVVLDCKGCDDIEINESKHGALYNLQVSLLLAEWEPISGEQYEIEKATISQVKIKKPKNEITCNKCTVEITWWRPSMGK